MGPGLGLFVSGTGTPDAEDASLVLIADPMADAQHTLDVPSGVFPSFTASPLEGWMAAAGHLVVVGFGPSAVLLTLTGDAAEELAVAGGVALPAGTRAADVALAKAPRSASVVPSPDLGLPDVVPDE